MALVDLNRGEGVGANFSSVQGSVFVPAMYGHILNHHVLQIIGVHVLSGQTLLAMYYSK